MNITPLHTFQCLMLSVLASMLAPATALAQEPRECQILFQNVDGPYQSNTWTNAIVPYEFDANVTPANQTAMLEAMAEIENISIVDFVLRTSQANYLHIQDSNGNNSYVGMIGGSQVVNIFNWNVKFIMCHELIHALGFWHTQQRSDRDDYVQIVTGNICCNAAGNFNIANVPIFGTYDFDSVMHYGACAFTTCGSCSAGCYTIVVPAPNQAWQTLIGQRDHLSQGDINSINFLYPPSDGSLIWVDFLYSGASNGTMQAPFSTLQAGLDAVASGGSIRIKPGSTSETFPDGINKAVTIEAASTMVTIGE